MKIRTEPTDTLKDLLDRLRELLPELRQRYAVKTLEVFGSRVRGDAALGSDLDLLVSFDRAPDLFSLIALENELADRLGMPVEVVVRRALQPRLRDRILAEAVAV